MARNTVDHDRRDIAADERADIADEFIRYICAFLIDPVPRNKALLIGDLMDILDFCVRRVFDSLKMNKGPETASWRYFFVKLYRF